MTSATESKLVPFERNCDLHITFQQADQVRESFFRGKVPVEPQLIFLYGAPGSGKSTVVPWFLNEHGIDPNTVIQLSIDAIVRELPTFSESIADVNERTDLAEDKRTQWRQQIYRRFRECVGDAIFEQMLNAALLNRYNITYETTGANITATRYQIARARRLGYRVVILFPFVPIQILLERVIARETRSGQIAAPPTFIDMAFHRAQENLISLSQEVDDIYLYDNTAEVPTIIFEYHRVYDFTRGIYIEASCPNCSSLLFQSMDEQLRTWILSFCQHCVEQREREF